MTSDNIPRRSFSSVFIAVLGAATAAIAGVPAAVYLLAKPKASDATGLVEIADVNQLALGKPEEIVYFRTRVDAWKRVKEKTTAWVVKTDAQHVVAFAPQCTHLGCIYHWESEENSFVCPCHASAFGIDGAVLAGPAPRPLDKHVTRVERGKVLIGPDILKA